MRRNLFPHHGRIKPKRESTFGYKKAIKPKRNTNDAEKAYLDYLQTRTDAKCMVCGVPVEHWHHVKEYSTDKKDHTSLIPLCQLHHVGELLSPHGTPKEWRKRYSMKFQKMVALKYYLEYKSEKVE